MVGQAKVTAAFRKLVALVARAFHAGECPPKTAEELAAPTTSRTKQQVEQSQRLVSGFCSVSGLRAESPCLTYTGHDTWLGDRAARCSVRQRQPISAC